MNKSALPLSPTLIKDTRTS